MSYWTNTALQSTHQNWNLFYQFVKVIYIKKPGIYLIMIQIITNDLIINQNFLRFPVYKGKHENTFTRTVLYLKWRYVMMVYWSVYEYYNTQF